MCERKTETDMKREMRLLGEGKGLARGDREERDLEMNMVSAYDILG